MVLQFSGKVEAKDLDEGLYARIYYYIIRNSGPSLFSIERTDGSLYTNATLDREKEDSYELYIKASNDPDFFMSKVFDLPPYRKLLWNFDIHCQFLLTLHFFFLG